MQAELVKYLKQQRKSGKNVPFAAWVDEGEDEELGIKQRDYGSHVKFMAAFKMPKGKVATAETASMLLDLYTNRALNEEHFLEQAKDYPIVGFTLMTSNFNVWGNATLDAVEVHVPSEGSDHDPAVQSQSLLQLLFHYVASGGQYLPELVEGSRQHLKPGASDFPSTTRDIQSMLASATCQNCGEDMYEGLTSTKEWKTLTPVQQQRAPLWMLLAKTREKSKYLLDVMKGTNNGGCGLPSWMQTTP